MQNDNVLNATELEAVAKLKVMLSELETLTIPPGIEAKREDYPNISRTLQVAVDNITTAYRLSKNMIGETVVE